jgi:peptide/nickel transport system permease protein
MLSFATRRFFILLLTLLVVSFSVFAVVASNERALRALAVGELGSRTTPAEAKSWINREIFHQCPRGERDITKCTPYPVYERYWDWLSGFVVGDWGYSIVFKKHILGYSEYKLDSRGDVIKDRDGIPRPNKDPWGVINERLGATGILAFWTFIPMVFFALVVGVIAGMNEGSKTDRSLSVLSIATTSMPEYVSGILFTVLFATAFGVFSWLAAFFDLFSLTETWFDAWAKRSPLKAVSNYDKDGASFAVLFLPVITVAIYGFGYIARMTRASMAEVMASQYIRTAILKGVPRRKVVLSHALRNALIAPFTIIMLQFPFLLSGVVIVEIIFNYKGFGFALNRAATNMDFNLIVACSVVSVIVVLLTQFISDIGYIILNPRLRKQ